MTGQGRDKDQGRTRRVSLQSGWSQSDIVPSARTRESYCGGAGGDYKATHGLDGVHRVAGSPGRRSDGHVGRDQGPLTRCAGSGTSDVV